MDILHYVERLERILDESRSVPLTTTRMVDSDRIYHVIDQMKTALPEEIRQAQRVSAERDRILAQANEEADRIRNLARQEAQTMVDRDAIVGKAEIKADNILAHAEAEADRVRSGADTYALSRLEQMEADMSSALNTIRNGVRQLERDLNLVPASQPAVSDNGAANPSDTIIEATIIDD